MDYKKYNTWEVLQEVEKKLEHLETLKAKYFGNPSLRIREVCDELSIFDWWNEYLSRSQLKQMRDFLRLAIELGFNGYVCFKVGATGCSNGMWAYTEETTTGFSPNGCDCIYRSFTPAYTAWSFAIKGNWEDENGNHRDYAKKRDFIAALEAARS